MPLTERLIARLPGLRLGWVLVWAALPAVFFFTAGAYGLLPPPGSTYKRENFQVFSFALAYTILFSLWATRRIASLVERLKPVYASMAPSTRPVEESWPFRSVDNAVGPLAITMVVTLTFMGPEFVRAPSWVTGLAVVIQFIGSLPLSTLFWVFGAILWGLSRLGGPDLRLAPFEEDASLGLQPFGTLAAVGFASVVALYVPIMLGGARDARSLVFNVVIIGAFIALLFLSVYRLHRRLVTEKAKHLNWARREYGRAFRAAADPANPVHDRSAELQIAAEAERRAMAIQTWPFDLSAFRTIGAIATGVVTALLVRLLLSRVGL